MDWKYKISVIMPVYNSGLYLRQAVESLFRQSFGDFELILADDCSRDGSGRLCDEFAKLHENVSVIHHSENKGPSAARNTGLAAAEGEYILFMDADDRIEGELFLKLLKALKRNPAKVTVFGVVEDYYDATGVLKRSYKKSFGKTLYLKSKRELRPEVMKLELKTLYGYAWNKLYEHDWLNKTKALFPDIKLIEDVAFNVKVFQELDSLNILNITPYRYRRNPSGSVTGCFEPEYFELHRQRIRLLYVQHREWGLLTDETRRELANLYVRYIFSALQRNCDKRSGLSHRGRRKKLRELYEEPFFNELICFSGSRRPALGLMSSLLKRRSLYRTLALGRIIFIVKEKLPFLFSSLKQGRS